MEIYIVIAYSSAFLLYLSASALKGRLFSVAALCSLTLGFLGNVYLIIRHLIIARRLPLTNTAETLLFAIAIIVSIFLLLHYAKSSRAEPAVTRPKAEDPKRHLLNIIGLSVSLISSLALVLSFWFLKSPLMPLLPALQSGWLAFHVSSCIIAYSFFAVAFIAALICIIRRNTPPLVILRIMHRSTAIGFLFLTLGIIMGSIWGKSAWGHWWNWDPKETWALITWLIYAGYIHGRLFKGWSEKRFAWIAIFGFLACLFTYLGVNFLLRGLHSYA